MIRNILAGYRTVLFAVIRFMLLMAVCVGAGVLVVYPLWRLADSAPNVYTLVFSVALSAIVLFFAVSKAVPAFRRDPRKFVRSVVRKLVLCAGLVACVLLVLSWQRLAAVFVLLVTLALYGFLAFGMDSRNKK